MRNALLACVIAVAATGCDDDSTTSTLPPPVTFESTCTATAPGAEAQKAAGRVGDGTVILPGGRRLTPAGTVLDVGGFPLALRVLPGDRYAVVTDGALGDEALRLVDLQAADPMKPVVSKVDYPLTNGDPADPALFFGLALTKDGKRLYVSNGGHDPVPDTKPNTEHYNTIEVYDVVGMPPELKRDDARTLHLSWAVRGVGAQNRYPSGIQLSSDEKLLYVACQFDNALAILSVADDKAYGTEIGRAVLPGIGPYDVAVDEASHTAFVSMWGGRTITAGKYVDGVALVDVTDPTKPMAMADLVPTGKASEAELLVAGKLYVANADADTLSVVDLASKAVKSSPVSASMQLGASPTAVAVDENAGRVYVASSGENSVVALDLPTLAPKGRIPTAWYPTAVAVRSDGSLVIASAKGLGLGPAERSPNPNGYMRGTLQVVPRPSDADLQKGADQVAANLGRPRSYAATPQCEAGKTPAFPLPLDEKGKSPIEHVFLVVRENKTYDALFGDLETGNGDPKLVMFGENNTPNAHALAREFVTMDNFYSLADQSLQGHEWTTASIANDYAEKGWLTTWGRYTRPAGAFASGVHERLGRPGSDPIFVHLDKAGMPYKNYGEVVNSAGAKINLDPTYPGVIYNIDTPDVAKISYMAERVDDAEFAVPFSYIVLPNDHTYGTTPGKLTPQSMVADNDEATGRFVDAISRSKLWPRSIVFVIEDDPQDGGDHVEPHRSICLVASPWVKRKAKTSAHYDVAAMYRTIELILGIGPMNQYDANAAPMWDIFSTKPDFTPYTFIPRKIPEARNTSESPLADESARIDFRKPDQAPLGRILWKATHGRDAEPPWREPGAKPAFIRDDDD